MSPGEDERSPETEPSGRLTQPPRWPPTAVGTGSAGGEDEPNVVIVPERMTVAALATVLQGLHSGMARCVQAHVDQGEG